ncbi:hypothetical protein HDU76_004880 [Blyttiomyces sp. JEL0837]|nr:hypothetical protein HDU76_004880 [Blyttiomyces sp. JEL0837]
MIDKSDTILNENSATIECKILDASTSKTVCQTFNVAIALDKIPLLDGKETGLNKFPTAGDGVLKGSCSMDEEWWFKSKVMGTGAIEWLRRGIDVSSSQVTCDAWVVNPVYMVSRWDTTNPYQAHQDFLNTFLGYATLNLSASDTQIMFLDTRLTDGPYISAWSSVFSSSFQIPSIPDLASLPGLSNTTQHVCFKRIVWGLHGGISPLAMNARAKGGCQGSPLLLAFRRFMLDRLRRRVLGGVAGIDPGAVGVFDYDKEWLLEGNKDPNSTSSSPSSEQKSLSIPKFPVPVGIKNLNVTPLDTRPREEREKGWNMWKKFVKNMTPPKPPFISRYDFHDIDVQPVVITYAIRKAGTKGSVKELIDTRLESVLKEGNGNETLVDVEERGGWSNRKPVRVTKSNQQQQQQQQQQKEKVQLFRTIENEPEVIESFRTQIRDWIDETYDHFSFIRKYNQSPQQRKYFPRFTFRAVDFATLTFEEQVAVAQETDVLIGPHGAVFGYEIYLRRAPVAGVVELQPPTRSVGNNQFRNLAYSLGHRYIRVPIEDRRITYPQLIESYFRHIVLEVYRIRRNATLAALKGETYVPPRSDQVFRFV